MPIFTRTFEFTLMVFVVVIIPQYKTIDFYQLQKCKWVEEIRDQEYYSSCYMLDRKEGLKKQGSENLSIHSYRAC